MALFKTPLRYPGGKQRLAPFIKEILLANQIDGHYVEPYAGGAGVAIELLLSKDVSHIHLNDSFLGIYAFWHTLIHENEKLCRQISMSSLNIKEWKKHREIVKNPESVDLFDLGYSIFYMNRCNRSGVISGGVIGGLEQNGNYKMDARFSRNDLIRRIELIGNYKDQISISNLDAEFYISSYLTNLPSNSLVYLDPPYYNKAKDLYLNSYLKEDHARLSICIQREIQTNWVLSYDGISEIMNLYENRRQFIYDLQYTAAKVYKGQEVFIFCDGLALPHESSLKHVNAGLKLVSR